MNKEIKFRAWHRTDKLMFWWNILWGNKGNGDGYVGMAPINETETRRLHKDNLRLIDLDNCEIMQFTGLKDKNGKEICEGDICSAMQGEQQKPNSFYPIKSRVMFWKGSFECFEKKLSDINCDDMGNAKHIMWCWRGHNNLPDIYEEINSIEIIGNVYENPELLK